MKKNGIYFIAMAFLVAELFKILIYANKRTCDVSSWTQDDVKSQHGTSVQKLRLQGWKFAELMCCKSHILW